jgi:adenine-specific DNA glycosylase
VDLDEVIAVIESAKPKASVLVVDACRHNPLPATPTRSATRGLAVVGRKPKNSVIIFAAEAGSEAVDGLFTPVFAKILAAHRDKSLNQVMQKVRSEVFNKSNGSQTPGEYNQLFEDVYLSPQN